MKPGKHSHAFISVLNLEFIEHNTHLLLKFRKALDEH
jgi:hypothetical protein